MIRQPGLLLLIKDMKHKLYSKVHLCYGKPELKLSSEPDDETLDPQAAILPNSLLSDFVIRSLHQMMFVTVNKNQTTYYY